VIAVSPERAAYEAGTLPPLVPWEELGTETKNEWRAIAQAAVKASPELARMEAAEAVCLMFGWTAARMGTDRDKALHELWRHWVQVSGVSLDPEDHPELSDVVIADLARKRDETRASTLAAIRQAKAPLCTRCGVTPVASPDAGPFGKFCEGCIGRCHESTDAFHRCPVCTATEEYAALVREAEARRG
jgi:hypothetical protein